MKPIRWRWNDGFRHANVEGVKMVVIDSMMYHEVQAPYSNDAVSQRVVIEIPNGTPKRCIDAAAYALADLVATLKGME